MGSISRFDAMLVAMDRKQTAHLVRVGALLARTKAIDAVRRRHDAMIDPLARQMLDSLVEQGLGDDEAAKILTAIIEATCTNMRVGRAAIQEAVNGAWELVIVMQSREYIATTTDRARMQGRFAEIERTLQVVKAWLLVTEEALARVPLTPDEFRAIVARDVLGHSGARITQRYYKPRHDPDAPA